MMWQPFWWRRRRRGPHGRRRAEQGSQVVEFSLVAPVLVLIVLTVLDGGRMLATYGMLKNAAREAALYAMEHTDATAPGSGAATASASDLKGIALNEGNNILVAGNLAVWCLDGNGQKQTGTCPSVAGAKQTMRVVELDYQFAFVSPALGLVSPYTLSATAASGGNN